MHEFPLVWFLVAFVSYTALLFLVSYFAWGGQRIVFQRRP